MKFGENFKKLFTGAAMTTAAVTALAQEAPKATEQLASNTKTEQVMSPQQQMEAAQASLGKTQVEFQNAYKRLAERFGYDQMMSTQLNELSDMPARVSLFAKGFVNGQIEDIDDSLDLQKFTQIALDFAHDQKSPLFKEMQAIQKLQGTMLGGLTNPEGANGQKDANGNTMQNAAPINSEDEAERALLAGQNNLPDRMIVDAVTFYVKQAALEKIKNANQNFEKAPLAQKDLDALKAISFEQAKAQMGASAPTADNN